MYANSSRYAYHEAIRFAFNFNFRRKTLWALQFTLQRLHVADVYKRQGSSIPHKKPGTFVFSAMERSMLAMILTGRSYKKEVTFC